MYNQAKIQKLKKVGWTFGLLFLVLICFFVGLSVGKSKQKAEQKPIKQEVVEKKEGLTTDTVQKFLIAYYTRKDLGENRNRYEPLVTSSMYNELTTEEDQPVNQAYKGYVVNQVLDSADIYINEENDTAICVVTYKNTQRRKIGSDEGALKNQSNQEAVQVTFTQQGKKFKVDKMEPVTLTNLLSTDKNSYNTNVTIGSEELNSTQSASINPSDVQTTTRSLEGTQTTSTSETTVSTTEESNHE
ncbi:MULTISPECIES: hypothetical protein [unclassified Enterococcus]|uniref:hypothetical protein n=1 Tax=unclassified Enterococcus TaxID=2608891 RepID=UPI001CE1C109|nr:MULTISPECIES: hypothetical protein [unclassified Enterococcus]